VKRREEKKREKREKRRKRNIILAGLVKSNDIFDEADINERPVKATQARL